MKLNSRYQWEEEDLAQPQPDRLLIIERPVMDGWLALVAYVFGFLTAVILWMVMYSIGVVQ